MVNFNANISAGEGIVSEIQRMSTEDGPGLRTTIFFKGCSLRCAWCHNPESISWKPQVQWMDAHCIHCLICLETCHQTAITATEAEIQINRDLCTGCGECTTACPAGAIELLGKRWSLDNLVYEVVKDRVYFEKSGGGVTVSGGEPVLQADFVAGLFKRLQEKGIHTALDTCGHYPQESLALLLPHADMVLYDLKEIDPVKHKNFTGSSNTKILENIIYLYGYMQAHFCPDELWIRTPIIPEATASEDNIRGIGSFIAANLASVVSRWELCAFNNLCRDKYLRLGLDWKYKESDLLSKSRLEELTVVARNSGVNPAIVHWSGATILSQ